MQCNEAAQVPLCVSNPPLFTAGGAIITGESQKEAQRWLATTEQARGD
jgi:hypothetical protein